MTPPKPKKPAEGEGRKKKKKGPTQVSPMQRVKVIGADGKVRFVWRPW
ncbi:hypothetical protein [Streptomyces sp. CC53]|nr:hypothetical protein [Streptomyces sp. CC53]